MATIDMERVQELVNQSAQRVGGRIGVKLAGAATTSGLSSDEVLTVSVTMTIGYEDGHEKLMEFRLPGSVLRLDEATLARILDNEFEKIARQYWQR